MLLPTLGSHYFTLADLKLLGLSDSSALASQVPGIPGAWAFVPGLSYVVLVTFRKKLNYISNYYFTGIPGMMKKNNSILWNTLNLMMVKL